MSAVMADDFAVPAAKRRRIEDKPITRKSPGSRLFTPFRVGTISRVVANMYEAADHKIDCRSGIADECTLHLRAAW